MPGRSPLLLDPHVVFLDHGSFGAVPAPVFEQRLYDEFRIETPVHRFRDQVLLGISIVAYNTDDVDALVDALTVLLEDHR